MCKKSSVCIPISSYLFVCFRECVCVCVGLGMRVCTCIHVYRTH